MEALRLPRRRRLMVIAAAVCAFLTLASSSSLAQRMRVVGGIRLNPLDPSDNTDDMGPSNFVPPDRNVLQVLARAKKALAEHRYGEALEGLAEVLRGSEDYLTQPDRKVPTYRGLKLEVLQLLGEMPREGRELYEVRSGAEARERLKRAVAVGDANALSDVSGRFFHTQAGYEATYLLALHYMDHGSPLAGALTLKRLREAGSAADGFEPGLSLTEAACYYQAGMTQPCQQVLVDLKRRLDRPSLQIGGREVPWFEAQSEAPDWLAKLGKLQRMSPAAAAEQWTMFRGDPSRTASTIGSAPLLNLRWQIEVAEEKTLADGLRLQATQYRLSGINVHSGLHPLAVGDFVIMRTATKLLGVNFATGKRIWEASISDSDQEEIPPVRVGRMYVGNNMSQPAQYGQRIWDDATYGTMSSDGKLVFVVEQLNLGVTGQYMMMAWGGARGEQLGRAVSNGLAAYEIQTGKVRWRLGGEDDSKKSDVFFLGPPLPLRDQLFVIAEIKDEIRLLALDAATGKELWHQQLATVEGNILQDPVRRLAGVSPSYADGVLICPTGSGCVVAVELATRSLLWGYVYQHADQQYGRRWRGMNQVQMGFANQQGQPVPRWLDGTATIAGGRVLLTPAEADMLYCLNLADGKPLWNPKLRVDRNERGEQLDRYYIACVHQGKVVLVGRAGVDAIKLEDGNRAWEGRTVTFPGGANATGHGFYAGNRYYVPLSSGEVVAIDLDAGKIVATAKSRKGIVPGNLVCYRGRVISQGLEGVELYYQFDAAKADSAQLLAKDPDDVDGLTLRGEIAMDEGRTTAAVADFRRAYSLEVNDKKSDSLVRTRELLRDALLDGLRDNFAAHRSLAGELEKLLDEPSQKAMYLRYMAMGLQRAGEWQKAIDFCMKLVDMDEKELRPELIERSYLVRRDLWVQARLAVIRRDGGAAAAAAIDKALASRLEEAKTASGCDSLKRFLGYFDGQPQATLARSELVTRLMQAGNVLGAELTLAAAADSSVRKAQAALLAEMATLNVRANRVSDAAACYRQLVRQFADVPCHDGQTPAAWLAALPGGDALRKEIDRPAADWPKGLVEVGKIDASARMDAVAFNRQRMRFDMAFGGPSGPYFTDNTISFDHAQQEISLRDGWGRARKPPAVRLPDSNGRMYGYPYNSASARSCGHLLLISVGTKIYAIDPYRASGNNNAIVWSHDLNEATSDNGNINAQFFVANQIVNGVAVAPSLFGPVNARVVCFQSMRKLVAVDPLSGEALWARQDIPQGSEIFGDDQYVFLKTPDKSEVTVYSVTDGECLGDRKLPRFQRAEQRKVYAGYTVNERNNPLVANGWTFVGRNMLTWSCRAVGQRRRL